MSRHSRPRPRPPKSIRGPLVAITNEYAGSDGDIFSHSFKVLELGPLIGKRTWGGVVGIWPRHALVDSTVTTQAEFATTVAKEVAKDLIPAPARVALILLALGGIGLLIYLLVR